LRLEDNALDRRRVQMATPAAGRDTGASRPAPWRKAQQLAPDRRRQQDDARLVARAEHGYLTAVGARLQVTPAERGDLCDA
jgi:hypothetical protein